MHHLVSIYLRRVLINLLRALKQISFQTFRHRKATIEYHKTKDILYVMKLLGHKNIKNTLVYTQLVTFEDDDYVCKAAANVKEATELIEAGYECVCDIETIKLFRKRKRTSIDASRPGVRPETWGLC
jgi:hypothetical protein